MRDATRGKLGKLGIAKKLPSLPRLTAIERLSTIIGDTIHCVDPGHSLLLQKMNSMALGRTNT
jgi:hypothetical protein